MSDPTPEPTVDFDAVDALRSAEEAAQTAEYGGSAKLAGLVHQQRSRARKAQGAARVLLRFLLGTVILALILYLALPFYVSTYLNGRQLTLDETARAIDRAEEQLDRDVEVQRTTLVAALERSAEVLTLPAADSVIFTALAQLADGSVLIAGTGGTVIRYDPTGETEPEKLSLPAADSVFYQALAQLADGGVLIAGDTGTVIRYDPTGDTEPEKLTLPAADSVFYRGLAQLADGSVLIAGDEGTVIRYDPRGETELEKLTLPAADNVRYFAPAQLADGSVLIAGSEGTVIRYDPTGDTEPEKLPLSAADGVLLYTDLAQLADGSVLIAGYPGTVIRYDPTGETEPEKLPLPAADSFAYYALAQLADGSVLIAGDEGTVIRYDPTDDTEPEKLTLPAADSVTYFALAQLADGSVLIAGAQGTLIRISDRFADEVESGDLPKESDLLGYIGTLQKHLQDQVASIQSKLTEIAGKRAIILQRRAENKIQSDNLPQFLLKQQQQTFAEFMGLCRGVPIIATDSVAKTGETLDPISGATANPAMVADGLATDPDAVTLACTQAWQAQLNAEEDNWWQILAQQVPPGILLLFLLATLGGLYRYNLRLAGFHHSRADALEMLAMGKIDSDIDLLVKLSDALAADKVEFGKANTPADQALEMFRAVMARTGK